MDDLDLLAREFGIRPGGKSAPMRSGPGDRRPTPVHPTTPQQNDRDEMTFSDVFGGPPKYTNSSIKSSKGTSGSDDLDLGSIFNSGNDPKSFNNSSSRKTSSGPVYDKPVYDDYIFEGLPGLKSKSGTSPARFDENVFATMASPPEENTSSDDLLGYLGREEVEEPKSSLNSTSRGFDDLLAAFDSTSPATSNRTSKQSDNQQPSKPSGSSTQTPSVIDDPFAVFGTSSPPFSSSQIFSDPLDEVTKPQKPRSGRANSPSIGGDLFGDFDPLNGFGKSVPPKGPSQTNESEKPFVDPPSYESANHSPSSDEPDQPSEDIWLTISEIPLSTQPTSSPPPSRPPPPIPKPSKIPPDSQLDELESFAMGKADPNEEEEDAINAEAKLRQEQLERERERQAVARATKEARERAAAEALQKASAEARERAERAAVQKAQAEARERAAFAAREKANAEARERESFFSASQNKGSSEGAKSSIPLKKASSTNNIVDDLSSIFGASSASSGEFQEVEGESEERRRARMERTQRTQERAAKALAEKNQRDLQVQREQEERHRIAESLDMEIKRWAAGKEGNLRSLLSTLQYVLWPECGWQPVSLTDLITAASVKKVYRKATLCIHPDKVQQKGATLQQKYVAEKVFDLLKEAWNKFNSEELF